MILKRLLVVITVVLSMSCEEAELWSESDMELKFNEFLSGTEMNADDEGKRALRWRRKNELRLY